ncbi:MAG TPA: PIN domain-containing protein [Duganella sp.]|jgi:hypothetical protein
MILFDTNIFVDMLSGVREATIELGYYDDPAISVITYIELRSGELLRPRDKPLLDAIFAEFHVFQLDSRVIEASISIRGNGLVNPPKIKLPDAIIAATALAYSMPLVTRNGNDFSGAPIMVHVPYLYNSVTGIVSNRAPHFPI